MSKFTKNVGERVFAHPRATVITLISVIIGMGGLVQSGESLHKYFPRSLLWVQDHAVILIGVFAAVVTALFGLSMLLYKELQCEHSQLQINHGQLQREHKELLSSHENLRGKRSEGTHNNTSNKIILFLSPNSEGDFYLQHFSHLVRSAAAFSDPHQQIHITLLCPPMAFQGQAPEMLLDSAGDYPANVAGVFMIPANPDRDENQAGIVRFKQKYPATVLLDVYPGTAKAKMGPSMPDFVGGDENLGGALAGNLAKRFFGEIVGKKTIRILILVGRTTEWEMQRVKAFKEALGTEGWSLNEEAFTYTNELHYRKREAREEIERRIANGDLFDIDLIFACNDEMAMGAMEAVRGAANTWKCDWKKKPKIIGYDGTPEMKSLIAAGNIFMLGTVDVRIEEQARLAINTMSSLLKAEAVPTRLLVGPRLITNDSLFPHRKP